jgi:hypothetical protein
MITAVQTALQCLTARQLRPVAGETRGPCLSIGGAAGGFTPCAVTDLEKAVQDMIPHDRPWIGHLLDSIRQLSLRDTAGPGIALFASPGFYRGFRLPSRIPEFVTVSGFFDTARLLNVVQMSGRYYLLHMSDDELQLFWGNHDGLMLLYSSHLRRETETRFAEFLSIVQTALSEFCDSAVPIVLAGRRKLCRACREAVPDAAFVLEEVRTGAGLPEEIELRARDIASAWVRSRQTAAVDEYHRYWHTQRTSNDPGDIASAARQGRIKVLFVSQPVLGREPAGLQSAAPGGSELELLNTAAINAFVAGAQIYLVGSDQVPGRRAAAAVCRE